VHWLPGWAWPVSFVGAWLVGAAFFVWTSDVLPNVDVGWRALVPGAIVGATGLLVLQLLGAVLVPRSVASASALWGALGVVFAVLAWLLLFGRLIVYTAVVDVVLYEAERGTVVSLVEIPNHDRATREANRSGTTRPEAPAAHDADLVPVAIPRDRNSPEGGFSTPENG
jgi:uncharacterized BrkB/YihY/UPF0761 family membrane protein